MIFFYCIFLYFFFLHTMWTNCIFRPRYFFIYFFPPRIEKCEVTVDEEDQVCWWIFVGGLKAVDWMLRRAEGGKLILY